VHQRGLIESVPLPEPHTPASDSSYGSTGAVPDDPGIVHGAVSVIRPDDPPELPPGPVLPLATLPVDAAVSPDGTTAAIVAAGSGAVLLLDVAEIESGQATRRERIATRGQPIAAAFAPGGRLWVQTRRPASVQSPDGSSIALGDEPGTLGAYEAAHDLFHLTASDRGALACASCHPEGSDDGRTWSFTAFGAHAPQLRRTQALRGGLTTGPLHWDGALADFNALVQEVLVLRMGGAAPGEGRAAALETWLLATARFPLEPAADAGAALRGDVLFHDAEVGCAACHAGDKLTNDTTVDVGTGELLQVPTLVGISHRAPFMHDGCAPTLLDRFGPCGGGDAHGHTSQLSAADLADLVAYLETL
jgi:mono/diheme cytochrome c family protein